MTGLGFGAPSGWMAFGFAEPLWLFGMALLGPLVALYFLERRRRGRRRVSSTLLFAGALARTDAARPHRRLLPLVSLLLQALAVVLAVLALASPRWPPGWGGPGRRPVVVVVDLSTSMAAPSEAGRREGDGTETALRRLDLARKEARSLEDELAADVPIGLVGAGPVAQVRAAPTTDRGAWRRALDTLEVEGGGPADLLGALAAGAEALAGQRRDGAGRLVVYTDGPLPDLAGRGLPRQVVVETRTLGAPLDNDAVVAASVTQPGTDPARLQVFVRVERRARSPAARFVTLRLAAGAPSGERPPDQEADAPAGGDLVGAPLLASRRLRLPADGGASLMLEAALPEAVVDRGEPPVLAVAVEPLAGAAPGSTLDDVLFLPAPAASRQPVVLVGPVPGVVTEVLLAAPDTALYRTEALPAAGEGAAVAWPRDPLWILAGPAPPRWPPGEVWWLPGLPADEAGTATTTGTSAAAGIGVGAVVPGSARVIRWPPEDPRWRYADPGDLRLRSVRPLSGEGLRSLLATTAGVAIGERRTLAGRITVTGIDPVASGWAQDPSFVVFARNLLEDARDRRRRGGVPDGPLGAPLRVPAGDDQEVQVTLPDGTERRAVARGDGQAWVPVPPVPGVYQVRVAGSAPRRVLRSGGERTEVDLRGTGEAPKPIAGEGTRRVAASPDPSTPGDSEAAAPGPAGAAPPLVALPFALALLGELAWASRRGQP